jgi:hypothetical protein
MDSKKALSILNGGVVPEIVYKCSVKNGHPKKIFSQEPKYPIYCCGKQMVKMKEENEKRMVAGSGRPQNKPTVSAPDITMKKIATADLKVKRKTRFIKDHTGKDGAYMLMSNIIWKAKLTGVQNASKLPRGELIRAIQTRENNTPCFGTGVKDCERLDCLWRKDCQPKK